MLVLQAAMLLEFAPRKVLADVGTSAPLPQLLVASQHQPSAVCLLDCRGEEVSAR